MDIYRAQKVEASEKALSVILIAHNLRRQNYYCLPTCLPLGRLAWLDSRRARARRRVVRRSESARGYCAQ